MGDIAIRVENLSKRYEITVGTPTRNKILSEHDYKLSHQVAQAFKKLWRVNSRFSGGDLRRETIWSLKDVSFEVRQGEVVGIIGRNGAGKSTLLKILSRVTEPTSGRAQINGRVGSLLEVGTGFHPDLTGRENVYLSGIILGMKKAEIDKKFDEIVAFADIEKFMDTPVKRYSSGMYVRLAFSVGAHLEPEILIVDEVLAVGDASFQKKCLNKMHDAGELGRTVLFVSHNLSAITRLCPRTILLDKGSIVADGPTHQVVSAYLHTGFCARASKHWPELAKAPGDDIARLRAVRVRTADGKITEAIDIRQSFAIEIEFDVLKPDYVFFPSFGLMNQEGEHLFYALDLDPEWRRRRRPTGRYVSAGWIPGNFLGEGTFFVGVYCTLQTPCRDLFHETEVVAFQVIDSLDGDTARGDYAGELHGSIRPILKWTTQFIPNEHNADTTQGKEDATP